MKLTLEQLVANDGERQAAPTLDGIRPDHVARYRWAAQHVPLGATVLDAACGCGYGAAMLADAGAKFVLGLDRDDSAIAYARDHYRRPGVAFHCVDLLEDPLPVSSWGAVVSLETVEHLDGKRWLAAVRGLLKAGGRLVLSTPNQNRLPWHAGYTHHRRHYTPSETHELLTRAGFEIEHVASNVARDSDELVDGWDGLFNIVAARAI